MRTNLAALIVTLCLTISSSGLCSSEELQQAMQALKKGQNEIALSLFSALADNGVMEAQFHVGAMYDEGQSVFQDFKEAMKWYRKAAEQGSLPAIFNLGTMYGNGDGVDKNNLYAYMWFYISASAHFGDSKKHLATITKKMTANEIARAKKLVKDCLLKKFKGCGPLG